MNYCSRRSARHHAGSPSNGLLSWIVILMTVNILSCHYFDCNAADHNSNSNIHHTAHHHHHHHHHASMSPSNALVDRQRRWTNLLFFGRRTSTSIIQGHVHFVGSPHYLNLRGGHAPSSYSSSSSSNGDVTKQQQQQQTQTAASSTSNRQQSPFEYIPITALDDYGQSTQLRHAMESANRFGTPVLACICCTTDADADDDNDDTTNVNGGGVENAIVVCSLQRPRPGVISPTHTTTTTSSSSTSSGIININSNHNKHHPSIQGMVRLLATRDDIHEHDKDASCQDDDDDYASIDSIPKHSIHSAIVTTGIQSDANFLLSTIQNHLSKYWFRYDILPSSTSTSSSTTTTATTPSIMVKMIRDVLLDCLGYDWGEELSSGKISGGIGSAAPSYEDEQDDEDNSSSSSSSSTRAGRPLGVSSFLLGLDSTTSTTTGLLSLTAIKANGASQQYVAHAMGMGSQLANEKLAQLWKRHMSIEQARDMMCEILRDVAKEKGWLSLEEEGKEEGSVESKLDGLTVAFEIVTSRGIDIEYLLL